jgi:hypothetical protein
VGLATRRARRAAPATSRPAAGRESQLHACTRSGDDATDLGTYGDTTYFMVTTDELPLLDLLRFIPGGNPLPTCCNRTCRCW